MLGGKYKKCVYNKNALSRNTSDIVSDEHEKVENKLEENKTSYFFRIFLANRFQLVWWENMVVLLFGKKSRLKAV